MIRTIITQDAEVDDQNSLKHFLFYTNEVELQGIVQTSSRFHWRGRKGLKMIPGKDYSTKGTSFETPFRWTGTEWMQEVLDAYELDYPNLSVHDQRYPSAEYLRSVTKIGNVDAVSDVSVSTEGSLLIKERMLDQDERKLYVQAWGGMNTIARALMDVEEECKGRPDWPEIKKAVSEKVVILACGEQDTSYRDYIAEEWPTLQTVIAVQPHSYSYVWYLMPESESKDTMKADFMKAEIVNGKSAIMKNYCTWMDGHYYTGEEERSQFGTNPNISTEWFGARMAGITDIHPYDFISEGDSPTFFGILDWGLRTTDDFSYGGFSGRYSRSFEETNSKGEVLNLWKAEEDAFTGYDGKEVKTDSMWRYVADIQHDFAARIDWTVRNRYEDAEHKPELQIIEGYDLTARAGETLTLHPVINSRDHRAVSFSGRIYAEAGSSCSKEVEIMVNPQEVCLQIPLSAKPQDVIHVIFCAEAEGYYRLKQYRQLIVTIV